MTDLTIGRDEHLVPNTSIPFSDSGTYVTLAAAGTANIAVPDDVKYAFIQIQSGANVFVGKSAITYSSSTSWQDADWDIVPAVRDVVGGTDTLYFYALDAAVIKVSWYRR